jgi:hypothetical protein
MRYIAILLLTLTIFAGGVVLAFKVADPPIGGFHNDGAYLVA